MQKQEEKKIYSLESKTWMLYNSDFLHKKTIEENLVDLIVTSPPYNVGINYSNTDDNLSYSKYLQFSERWLKQALNYAKPDCRLCLNIPLDKNKNGIQSVGADIINIAKEVGWKYQSTIIWNESNISRRTAWGSWLSASAPYVIAPVELIVCMYKETWKKGKKGKSDITKQEFMDWTLGIWNFNGETKKVGHPAAFPLELPRRCIKLFSYVGDVVLDPFSGSGTTIISAVNNQRKAIGFEISEKYYKVALNRIKNQTVNLIHHGL